MKKQLALIIIAAAFISSCKQEEKLIVTKIPDRPAYIRQSSPGKDYVWLEGDFVVKNGKYQWKKGRWEKAKNKNWIDGDWAWGGKGWYWREGYWQGQ